MWRVSLVVPIGNRDPELIKDLIKNSVEAPCRKADQGDTLHFQFTFCGKKKATKAADELEYVCLCKLALVPHITILSTRKKRS